MTTEIITAVVILTALGLLFATILAIAYKKLKVEEDPRIDIVEEMLPKANCGACGSPGCRAFAEMVVNKTINPGKCTVSSPDAVERIAQYMGIEASHEEKVVARLLCAGGKNEAHNMADYRGGLKTCRGEAMVAGGPKQCSWGCLGLADCEKVCDFDAIHMNANGLPVVDIDKCIACGDCVEICPKQLFVLMPVGQKLIVQCKSLLEGKAAENLCSVACTACGKCVADAAPGLIEIRNNLATIQYEWNVLASPQAIKRCPTDAIVWLENAKQFETKENTELPIGKVESVLDLGNVYYQ
ncbi:MAG: RnfABCDGE type electron transport complex subunit B [Saprospiraceae bacterium]|nr:RnfABCDGE type electron transport complex subunit B [Saprospiraceae bacterium]